MRFGKLGTLVGFIAMVLFVVFFDRIVNRGYSFEQLLAFLVLAPLIESFLFIALPLNFGIKHKLINEFMWLSCFVFAYLHSGNYPVNGFYYAMMVQGTFCLVSWYICKCMGYRFTVAFHFVYNLFIISI